MNVRQFALTVMLAQSIFEDTPKAQHDAAKAACLEMDVNPFWATVVELLLYHCYDDTVVWAHLVKQMTDGKDYGNVEP